MSSEAQARLREIDHTFRTATSRDTYESLLDLCHEEQRILEGTKSRLAERARRDRAEMGEAEL